MRVLIPCLHYFKDRPSGGTRLACDEAMAFAESGHEVWIVCQGNEDAPEYVWDSDAHLHVLRYAVAKTSANVFTRSNYHQHAASEIVHRLSPGSFDIIHGHSILQLHGVMDHVGPHGVLGYTVHSPVLMEYRANGWRRPLGERLQLELRGRALARLERNILQKVDFVTADSEYTRNVMSTLYGTEIGGRITHMPGWVDVDKYRIPNDRTSFKQVLGWPLDEPLLFTLRRLTPRNGIQTLLKATKLLLNKGHRFRVVIAGDGPLRAELSSMADRLNIRTRVTFTGRIPEDHIPLAYGAADLFVLPTARLECFGLIILESFAAGTPVIGTPVGSIPELITPIEPEWIARENSASELAAKMGNYLDGTLPVHTPEHLRLYAEQFSKAKNLKRLVDYVFQQASNNRERG